MDTINKTLVVKYLFVLFAYQIFPRRIAESDTDVDLGYGKYLFCCVFCVLPCVYIFLFSRSRANTVPVSYSRPHPIRILISN